MREFPGFHISVRIAVHKEIEQRIAIFHQFAVENAGAVAFHAFTIDAVAARAGQVIGFFRVEITRDEDDRGRRDSGRTAGSRLGSGRHRNRVVGFISWGSTMLAVRISGAGVIGAAKQRRISFGPQESDDLVNIFVGQGRITTLGRHIDTGLVVRIKGAAANDDEIMQPFVINIHDEFAFYQVGA